MFTEEEVDRLLYMAQVVRAATSWRYWALVAKTILKTQLVKMAERL